MTILTLSSVVELEIELIQILLNFCVVQNCKKRLVKCLNVSLWEVQNYLTEQRWAFLSDQLLVRFERIFVNELSARMIRKTICPAWFVVRPRTSKERFICPPFEVCISRFSNLCFPLSLWLAGALEASILLAYNTTEVACFWKPDLAFSGINFYSSTCQQKSPPLERCSIIHWPSIILFLIFWIWWGIIYTV